MRRFPLRLKIAGFAGVLVVIATGLVALFTVILPWRAKLAAHREDFRVDWARLRKSPELDILLRWGDAVRVDPLVSSVRVEGEVAPIHTSSDTINHCRALPKRHRQRRARRIHPDTRELEKLMLAPGDGTVRAGASGSTSSWAGGSRSARTAARSGSPAPPRASRSGHATCNPSRPAT